MQEPHSSKNLLSLLTLTGLAITVITFLLLNRNLQKRIDAIKAGDLDKGSITLDKLAEEIEVPVEVTLENGERVKGIIVEGEIEDGEVIGDLVLQLENGDTVTWSGGLKEVPQTGEEPDTTITNVTNVTNQLELEDGSVTTEKLADEAVTEIKIMDGSISNSKLQDGIIYANNLTTDSVLAIHIKDGEVTTSEILNGTITNADISNTASIDWTKISKVGSSLADLDTADAVDVNIADAGGYFTGSDVETALQELGATAFSGAYVLKAGDTMTGPLIIDLSSNATGLVVQGAVAQTANLTEWQNSSGTVITSMADYVATDNSTNFIRINGTLPAVPTTSVDGVRFIITSAGSSAQVQVALRATLNAGYTGSNATAAASFTNNALGTQTATTGGNLGVSANALGAASGQNLAVRGIAFNSTVRNIGILGQSNVTSAGDNIGVWGLGGNGTGKQIGVFASLDSTAPNASAALISNNGTQVAPILLGQDNGTTVFTIADGGGVTNTVTSASLVPLTVKGAASQTANLQEWQNSSGTAYAYIGPDTLAGTATTLNFLNVTATLPSTPSAAQNGVLFNITGAGSSAFSQRALTAQLNAGYTGATDNYAINALNSSAGTGSNVITGVANFAIAGTTNGTTTGLNVGVNGGTAGGDINIGVRGAARVAKNGATNIGVFGNGLNTGTTPVQIGGYFSLLSSAPTFTSAALIANNGTQTDPIFLGQDNGTTVFQVADGGGTSVSLTNAASTGLTIKGAASQTATLQEWQNSSGTVLSHMDAGGRLRLNSASSGARIISVATVGEEGGYFSSPDDWGLSARSGSTSGKAALLALATDPGAIGIVVRGAASQTANLQEWQNSSSTALAVIDESGNFGIGVNPLSALHVPDGKYAQFEDNNAIAPPSADCDSDTERGRISMDTVLNRLYICNGASRGWDWILMTD